VVRVTGSGVIWHDVEHGSYDADLPLWRQLADATGGPVLDLGAGTGRVSVDLAAHGHDVVALDSDPELLAELSKREPSVRTVLADAREFSVDGQFPLVIAPMSLVQILGGHRARVAMLRSVHAQLSPGGLFAASISDPNDAVPAELIPPPLPDILERDGWVFSSQPLTMYEQDGSVIIERRRQAVSPGGEMQEEDVQIEVGVVSLEQFEAETREAGLRPVARKTVPETLDHVGSTVVLCRR
jgi:SAM-dependent methyltransferase